MCQGVLYQQDCSQLKTYFTEPGAQLAVEMPVGGRRCLSWGRRLYQPGQLPYGGIVFASMIDSDRWQPFFPKPVIIVAEAFFLRDLGERMRYYRLVKGQFIQGYLARYQQEERIYIAVHSTQAVDAVHAHWPCIIYQAMGN